MKILDANLILRYMVQDDPEKAEKVKQLLKSEKVMIVPEVISEVIYVMVKVYHYDRIQTAEGVFRFLNLSAIVMEHPETLRQGVILYKNTRLDFVDCLLAAYHAVEGYEVCTFDKKLQKLMQRMDTEQ